MTYSRKIGELVLQKCQAEVFISGKIVWFDKKTLNKFPFSWIFLLIFSNFLPPVSGLIPIIPLFPTFFKVKNIKWLTSNNCTANAHCFNVNTWKSKTLIQQKQAGYPSHFLKLYSKSPTIKYKNLGGDSPNFSQEADCQFRFTLVDSKNWRLNHCYEKGHGAQLWAVLVSRSLKQLLVEVVFTLFFWVHRWNTCCPLRSWRNG